MADILLKFHSQETVQRPRLDPLVIAQQLGATDLVFLGNGAFGETWECKLYDAPCAIKIITHSNFSAKRIQKEIEGLTRVASPHVVAFLDYLSLQYGAVTHPVLKFELIRGNNLGKHLTRNHWPDFSQIASFIIGILSGLLALHDAGVIHRDLKPENIILRNGSYTDPTIVDLGLARIIDSSQYTHYPALVGTLPYMAPEQIRGEPARKGSDLWAIGVILYLLLTSKHPFFRISEEPLDIDTLLDRIYAGPPQIDDDVPAILKELATRFLSFEPYQRGSAARALRDLKGGIL